MAHHVEREIETTCAQEPAFDYVAEFSTAAEWDPGIPSARRLDDVAVGPGSRFELVSRFGNREQAIVYEIVEYDRPHRVALRGEGDNFRGTDEISFMPIGAGTRIRYVAEMGLKGLGALALPFIGGRLDEMSDNGMAGLKAALDQRS